MPDGGGDVDGGYPAQGCLLSGGLCLPSGACTAAVGTVAALGGCSFSDGPAECCVPLAPKAEPRVTCGDHGGVCAPIGGCLQAGGWMTPPSTGTACNMGPSYTCCVPHAQCGEPTMDCCSGTAVFRQACADGTLLCSVGDPVPLGTCL
jgi:hypothetical protein